jgi:hypothetical protein
LYRSSGLGSAGSKLNSRIILKSHPQILKQRSDEAASGGNGPRGSGCRPAYGVRKHRSARTPQNHQPLEERAEEEKEERLPRVGSLARTKRLLMAALRVWELKNGIRD